MQKVARDYTSKQARLLAGTWQEYMQKSTQKMIGTRAVNMLEKYQEILKKVQKKGCKELGNEICKKVAMNQEG